MNEPGNSFGPFAARRSPERGRLREAVIDLALEEEGLDALSVEAICERADIDVDGFERDFGSVQNCALQIYLANLAEFDRVLGAAVPAGPWRLRLRATAYTVARYVLDHPRPSRFDMIAMLGAGDLAHAHRDRYVRRLIGLIDEGRLEMADPEELSPTIAEGVFGSIYQQLARELQRDGGRDRAAEIVPQLMYLAVRPYLGEEAAREELTIPPPPEWGPSGGPSAA